MSALHSLVQAERAFASASIAHGTRDAFLAFLADDAILFRPRAIPGREWWLNRPPAPGLLTWQPTYAEVSRAGDLGYTTGPWEYRERRDLHDQPVGYGHFVSIWQQQADGEWKVHIDLGISCPPPPTPFAEWQPIGASKPIEETSTAIIPADEHAALLDSDRAFASTAEREGAANAYRLHAIDDARLFRMETPPFVGQHEIHRFLSERNERTIFQPQKSRVAQSGDLGFTYGSGEEHSQPCIYVRIWKKHAGAWRIALDITNPTTS